MTDINSRIIKIVNEIAGNEGLLQMLDADAASEMLNWAIAVVTKLVNETTSLDDAAAELVLLPRLKAVRLVMRSVGNWAAGKYADSASRELLRDKLIESFNMIFGDGRNIPTRDKTDSILNQVVDKNKTPIQLILSFKSLTEESL